LDGLYLPQSTLEKDPEFAAAITPAIAGMLF
jgi:hypothetical protein